MVIETFSANDVYSAAVDPRRLRQRVMDRKRIHIVLGMHHHPHADRLPDIECLLGLKRVVDLECFPDLELDLEDLLHIEELASMRIFAQ